MKLAEMETHVFIDVSNIRSACLSSCRIRLDFPKLISYFQQKYTNLKAVKYFEGVADGDSNRLELLKSYHDLGYEICSLQRKIYIDPAKYKTFNCKSCGEKNKVRILKPSKKMKSNVDVYLATELLNIAHSVRKPTHVILMACDGDYAEMIKSAIDRNRNIHITVLATPTTPKNNALSVKLKQLRHELPDRYLLRSVVEIKDRIS